jgi:ABC-type uncharacterized transport system ATPase subunit
VESLDVEAGRRVAVLGFDGPTAEVFVGLLTGASLPDEGRVVLMGRDTATITAPEDWFAALDRIGMVSVRAVMVGEMTVAQNIGLAFSLSVDPMAPELGDRVRRLSVEAGVPLDDLDRPLGATAASTVARCHLARSLASDPALLVLEHANALTTPADAQAFGRDVARVARERRLGVLAMTADGAFGDAVADRVLSLDPATGRLIARSGWRRFFTRG